MQSDIFKKIDTLVEMAGVSTNIDTLKAELNEIEKESKKLKNELVSLTGDSTDRYFKASEKQVDENIKVSLESKIKRQEKALKDLQKQIDSMVEEEEKLHNELSDINETIESSNDYIATLNTRLSTLTSDESLKNYKNIITRENEKLDKQNIMIY
jgi:chromosome segregation ATPase